MIHALKRFVMATVAHADAGSSFELPTFLFFIFFSALLPKHVLLPMSEIHTSALKEAQGLD